MSIETMNITINIQITIHADSPDTSTSNKLVSCLKCNRQIYKRPSKIKEHNFCSVECYREYQRSTESTLSKGWKHTEEAKQKIRNANIQRNYDEILTQESRQKMADTARNKKWTNEAREKLRQANLGKKLSEAHKLKIKAHGKFGKDNFMWNDEAKYVAMHLWVSRHKGKAKKCIDCGATENERKIEWSNIDHKYRRNLEDYIERCTPCHRKYDKTLKAS